MPRVSVGLLSYSSSHLLRIFQLTVPRDQQLARISYYSRLARPL